MSYHPSAARLHEAYSAPNGVIAAAVEYVGPWPDGGSGMCARSFPASSVSESNQLAHTFLLALEAGVGRPPIDRGDFWELAA